MNALYVRNRHLSAHVAVHTQGQRHGLGVLSGPEKHQQRPIGLLGLDQLNAILRPRAASADRHERGAVHASSPATSRKGKGADDRLSTPLSS